MGIKCFIILSQLVLLALRPARDRQLPPELPPGRGRGQEAAPDDLSVPAPRSAQVARVLRAQDVGLRHHQSSLQGLYALRLA